MFELKKIELRVRVFQVSLIQKQNQNFMRFEKFIFPVF